jgi:hypothetical protein
MVHISSCSMTIHEGYWHVQLPCDFFFRFDKYIVTKRINEMREERRRNVV